jgi:hypothetical protein
MTTRTYTQKDGTVWEWEETPETFNAIQEVNNFAGNYQGPLYAPHPDLKNGKKTD